MKPFFLKKKQAVTLIELLLATILIMLIFAGGTVVTIGMMRFTREESAENFAADNLVNALEWIRKDAMSAFSADVSIVNEVTLLRYYTGIAGGTFIASTRYYVMPGTNSLFRDDSFPGSTTLITDMINADSPPVFSTPTSDENFLRIEIWIRDPVRQVSARSWSGAFLRCRGSGTL